MLSWNSNIWPPDVKNWLTGRDSDAGKGWRQEKKGQQRVRWLDGITDWIDKESDMAEGEGSHHFGELFNFSASLPCLHVI